MNCVGIDISKGKSMIAVMRSLGEIVVPPFEVGHTNAELCELSQLLGKLDGETHVVMEATGNYHLPVASFLYDSGFYVSVVNAMLVHGYGNNSLRLAKTDKKDAIKLANYSLDHWLALPKYIPEDEVRLMLKTTYRQYQQCTKVQTILKKNLISLLDTAFPDANRLFSSPAKADGSEKWVDFIAAFPHCECVCGLSEKAFAAKYQKWCKKHGYAMLNGMLWIVRSGAQWREMPEAYGPWQSVYARFAKWQDDGTLEAIFSALSADADMENLSLDSTCIKVHENANGGGKRRIRQLGEPEAD